MKITLENISIDYNNEILLDNISCVFNEHKISCLLGKSGSGKTTILKMIAGLEKNYRGTIYADNKNIMKLRNTERNIGWVPQQQLLFPNKNVRENIEFGMKVKKWNKEKIDNRILEVVKLTGTENLLSRGISRLSGGEKQRVALARAIAPNPNLLLLDEPFSSLDAPEREKFALLFRQIQLETGITTIYVTHSPKEAELMSDYLFVLSDKSFKQFGYAREVFMKPNSIEVAQLLNIPNTIPENILEMPFDVIIPRDAIEFSEDGQKVKVVSITRDTIYFMTSSNITIETDFIQDLYPGQEISIKINLSKCIEFPVKNIQ